MGSLIFSQGIIKALVSVFPNDAVENLTAEHTPPAPEGTPSSIIFFFDHQSLAPMTIQGDLLQRILDGDLETWGIRSLLHPKRALAQWEKQRSCICLIRTFQEIYQPGKKKFLQ
jgi:hypothetical protein